MSGPLKSTDKRRAGYSDNMGGDIGGPKKPAKKRNGTSKASSNEFHAGKNGTAKRSS